MANQNSDAKADSEELAAFVTSTLIAITKGIHDAQQEAMIRSAHGTGVFGFSAPKEVEFDVAVTAKKVGAAQGGFKVEVFSIGAHVGGEKGSESSSVSRIKFNIPSHYKSTKGTADDGGSWKTA